MGPQGVQGPQGSRWYSGLGAPAGDLGLVSDWYLDVNGGNVYEKTSAAGWTLRDNLTGPEGTLDVQTATMTSAQAFSALAMADVTQLVLPVLANSRYSVEAYVTFQTTSSLNALNLGVLGPTDSRFMGEIIVPVTNDPSASHVHAIYPNAATPLNQGEAAGTGSGDPNSNHTALVSGTLVTSTAGQMQIRAASIITLSAITLQPGSELCVVKLV